MAEIRYGCDSASIDVTDPQRQRELAQALERGINTWEAKPAWIVSLVDELKEGSREIPVTGHAD